MFNMKKFIKFPLFLFGMVCLVLSCSDDGVDEPAPDVSNISADFDLYRFDQQMYAITEDNVEQNLSKLVQDYKSFSDIYFTNILPLKVEETDDLMTNFKQFLAEDGVDKLADTIQEVFEDMTDIQEEYKQASKYLKYYFPLEEMPDVYTFYSGFAMQRFIFSDDEGKDAIGIGLDMFLGSDFDYKSIDPSNPNFSDYLTRSFNKDHMVKKSVDLTVDELVGPPSGIRLIDYMIHAGKKLYITKQILPFKHDSVIIEYTADQIDWCEDNELEMWSFFFDKDLFYETNANKISKYVRESPHSPGMPPSSPGRTADYLGWQIVKNFMSKNPDLLLQDLIDFKDSQKILEMSKYKPRRRD